MSLEDLKIHGEITQTGELKWDDATATQDVTVKIGDEEATYTLTVHGAKNREMAKTELDRIGRNHAVAMAVLYSVGEKKSSTEKIRITGDRVKQVRREKEEKEHTFKHDPATDADFKERERQLHRKLENAGEKWRRNGKLYWAAREIYGLQESPVKAEEAPPQPQPQPVEEEGPARKPEGPMQVEVARNKKTETPENVQKREQTQEIEERRKHLREAKRESAARGEEAATLRRLQEQLEKQQKEITVLKNKLSETERGKRDEALVKELKDQLKKQTEKIGNLRNELRNVKERGAAERDEKLKKQADKAERGKRDEALVKELKNQLKNQTEEIGNLRNELRNVKERGAAERDEKLKKQADKAEKRQKEQAQQTAAKEKASETAKKAQSPKKATPKQVPVQRDEKQPISREELREQEKLARLEKKLEEKNQMIQALQEAMEKSSKNKSDVRDFIQKAYHKEFNQLFKIRTRQEAAREMRRYKRIIESREKKLIDNEKQGQKSLKGLLDANLKIRGEVEGAIDNREQAVERKLKGVEKRIEELERAKPQEIKIEESAKNLNEAVSFLVAMQTQILEMDRRILESQREHIREYRLISNRNLDLRKKIDARKKSFTTGSTPRRDTR